MKAFHHVVHRFLKKVHYQLLILFVKYFSEVGQVGFLALSDGGPVDKNQFLQFKNVITNQGNAFTSTNSM